MKAYATIILLFGIALVQSQPTTKTVKSKSDLKDWMNEKKSLAKIEDGSTIDEIKQGNRTKKSVVCLEIPQQETEICPPGCCNQHQGPSGPQIIHGPAPLPPQTPTVYHPDSPGSFVIPPMPQPPSMSPGPIAMPLPPSRPPGSFVIPPMPQPPSMSPGPIAMPLPPSRPPGSFVIPPMPQPPSMSPGPIAMPPMPPPPPMSPGPYVIPPPSNTPMMIPSPPRPPSQPPIAYPPISLPPTPQIPSMPPAFTPARPPQIVGTIPQLPPCPPEEQYLIPGTESKEVITYEVVPVSHHIPSSPSQLITTPKPPYPCIPAGQAQQIPQQQAPSFVPVPQQQAPSFVSVPQQQAPSFVPVPQQQAPSFVSVPQQQAPSFVSVPQLQASSFATVQQQQASSYAAVQQQQQQQAIVNQVQIPQGNLYPIAPTSYQYPQQLPSYSPPLQPVSMTQPVPSYPPVQQLSPNVHYHVPDCIPAAPAQQSAYGFQASQSAAQSYASAQNAAYSGFGVSSFRSAQDGDDEAVTIHVQSGDPAGPQIAHARNSYHHGYYSPPKYNTYKRASIDDGNVVVMGASPDSSHVSIQGTSFNELNGQPIKELTKRGAEKIDDKKVKA